MMGAGRGWAWVMVAAAAVVAATATAGPEYRGGLLQPLAKTRRGGIPPYVPIHGRNLPSADPLFDIKFPIPRHYFYTHYPVYPPPATLPKKSGSNIPSADPRQLATLKQFSIPRHFWVYPPPANIPSKIGRGALGFDLPDFIQSDPDRYKELIEAMKAAGK